MTDPAVPQNTPVQADEEEILSHLPDSDEPDGFLDDAVSGSETTSDAPPTPLGQSRAVHPDLDVEDADVTETEGPDLSRPADGSTPQSPETENGGAR